MEVKIDRISRWSNGVIFLSDEESLIHEILHDVLNAVDAKANEKLDNLVCNAYPNCSIGDPCGKGKCAARKIGRLFKQYGVGW